MSSKSKTEQTQSTSQQDNRIVADNGAVAISGSSGTTVNVTDQGLISAAFDYFKEKDALTGAAAQSLIEAAKGGFETVTAAGSNLLTQAGQAANPQGQQSRLEMMLLAVAALFIFTQFRGAK